MIMRWILLGMLWAGAGVIAEEEKIQRKWFGVTDEKLVRRLIPSVPDSEGCLEILKHAVCGAFPEYSKAHGLKPENFREADVLLFSVKWDQTLQQIEEQVVIWAGYKTEAEKKAWLLGAFARLPYENHEGEFADRKSPWSVQASLNTSDDGEWIPLTLKVELATISEAEVSSLLRATMAGSSYGDETKERLSYPDKYHFLRLDLFLEEINARLETPISRKPFQEAFSFLDFPMLRDPE